MNQPIADGPANKAAQERMLGARGSIFGAFDNLGCGMSHEEAVEYLRGSLVSQTFSERDFGRVIGMALGFAIVAVESDRQLAKRGRWRLGR